MAAITAPPSTASIFQYPPNFPAGVVNSQWITWFNTVQANTYVFPAAVAGYAIGWDALGNLVNVPNTGADQTAVLADTTLATNGAGRIGYNGALSYATGTVGNQVSANVTAIAARLVAADASTYLDQTKGAALIGFNPALTYPGPSVGSHLNALATASPNTGASLIGYLAPYTGAVATTQQERNSRSVSVLDFMTDAQRVDVMSGTTPTLDTSAAVQAAVAYCVSKGYDLEIPGLCRIVSSINIDRAVDGAAFDSYFKIFTRTGGGFYVDSAINLFSSSIAYTTSPVTQLTMFEGLRFVCSSTAINAYVLDGGKFLRTVFDRCSFSKIKCLTTANYIQSIYFFGCNARRWTGTFLLSSGQGYDVQVIGGLYEAGTGDGFNISSPIGCKFITQIEGMTGTALIINGAQGVDISCYFEANGLDIDCRTGGLPNYGINLHGSYLSHANATYSVKWGTCKGCTSTGNWHTWNMHDLQADSMVAINDYAQTNLSNTSEAVANVGYREGAPATFGMRTGGSAGYTVSAQTAVYTRNGKRVSIDFTLTLTSTGTNSADTLYITSGLPINAATFGQLCGMVEVVGSTLNNGISPLYLSAVDKIQSSIQCVPANTVGNSWTVRGNITYTSA